MKNLIRTPFVLQEDIAQVLNLLNVMLLKQAKKQKMGHVFIVIEKIDDCY